VATGGVTLTWFGCTTFRVQVGATALWFDTFVDRAPGTDDVGLRSADIDRADFVFVSHAHFDHMLGADTVAANTGAPVVASYETARVLSDVGVPSEQLWAVSGGETVDCGDDVRVRVLPSLHSCLYASSELDVISACVGDLGISYQERRARTDGIWTALEGFVAPDYFASIDGRTSRRDGGQLNYLLETPHGSVFVAASSGYWSGILRDLRPDVALLAVTGRPNVDGEPFQGSMADFIVGEVETLRPSTVVFCHHDSWLPMLPALDVDPIAHALRDRTPAAKVERLSYADPVRVSG
jgi:L-ascorbate metabolism protein UlaG (beta-lactamase superfamily)